MNKKNIVIIPAYNEAKILRKLIPKIKDCVDAEIVIVNDGSSDDTTNVSLNLGATVLEHAVNRGAGAATITGIQYAVSQKSDFVITMDGDGQHNPSETENLLKILKEEKLDIVIGARLKNRKKMPIIRRLFNFIGNFITFAVNGIYLHDSQSGFKAFTLKAARLIKLESDGYEFCSEFIKEIKRNKLKYKEVPIETIYSDYSLSKGQSFAKGISMLVRLFLKK